MEPDGHRHQRGEAEGCQPAERCADRADRGEDEAKRTEQFEDPGKSVGRRVDLEVFRSGCGKFATGELVCAAEEEDELDKFRVFLDQVKPEDFNL